MTALFPPQKNFLKPFLGYVLTGLIRSTSAPSFDAIFFAA
jgi:hypothetical protein